jgi:very-short-patch-repair endonuclease
VTDRFETVTHLVECLDPEFAVAALDSFLHTDPVRSRHLEAWLGSLPERLLVGLPSRSAQCESFLESVGRIRLERAGITGEHQVEFPGVGRVDLVIDHRLVIEWDGGTHRTAEQQDEDCRRDALLATMGYRTLRFSYHLVMDEWHIVIAAVRAALDEVGCAH